MQIEQMAPVSASLKHLREFTRSTVNRENVSKQFSMGLHKQVGDTSRRMTLSRTTIFKVVYFLLRAEQGILKRYTTGQTIYSIAFQTTSGTRFNLYGIQIEPFRLLSIPMVNK
jgi:hypothetical protein